MKRKPTFFWICLMLTGLVFLAGYSGKVHAEGTVTVSGKAYFNGPIEAAAVTILDAEGSVLASKDDATNEGGNFCIPVPESAVGTYIFIEVEGGYVKKVEYAEDTGIPDSSPEIVSVTEEPFMEIAETYAEAFNPIKIYVATAGPLNRIWGDVDVGGRLKAPP